MAEYLILIHEDENGYANASPDVFQQVMEAHTRFAQQVEQKGGKIVSGNALQPTSTATTIRGDVVTDGPFAETKEALGGYYLIGRATWTTRSTSPSSARRASAALRSGRSWTFPAGERRTGPGRHGEDPGRREGEPAHRVYRPARPVPGRARPGRGPGG